MPFVPHTEDDVKEMLLAIGVNAADDLFDEIPKDLQIKQIDGIPSGLSEMQISKLMQERAEVNAKAHCFIGAGAYEHHIPSVVWKIASRGEFLTAYTPYQAEASQGTLQVIYEFQTMMASLTGMDVSNASMYDGASSLSEAILMAIRCNKKSQSKKILILNTVHPNYYDTVKTIVSPQAVELITVPFDLKQGCVDTNSLKQFDRDDIAAIVIPQPNFFGCLEKVDALTLWAHTHNALVIAVVNPTSLALLKEPGQWGNGGADIVCGERQPFCASLFSGGPYCGFLCCKQEFVRNMPGRIVGRTVDTKGKSGFVLTLQAREQHIRRAKATSNICSNEGLMTAASAIYMSLLGPTGLRQAAEVCHTKTQTLLEKALKIKGVKQLFKQPYFHEVVLQLPKSVDQVIEKMMFEYNIQAGFNLSLLYPELKNALLVCCTETKSDEEINLYADALTQILNN